MRVLRYLAALSVVLALVGLIRHGDVRRGSAGRPAARPRHRLLVGAERATVRNVVKALVLNVRCQAGLFARGMDRPAAAAIWLNCRSSGIDSTFI